MKKTLLYGLATLAVLSFAGCNGDYDDWASPQANGQEEAKNVTLNVVAASAITLADVETDSVTLFTPSIDCPDATSVLGYRVELGKTDDTGSVAEKKEITADLQGRVATADLASVVEGFYGKRPTARTMPMVVVADVLQGEQAFYATSNQTSAVVTPEAPFIDTSYYLVGSLDGWTCKRVEDYKLTNSGSDPYDDPVFSITIPSPGDVKVEFKVIPQSAFAEDGTIANWNIALSASETGEEGKFSANNAGGNIAFEASASIKKYKIEFNMMDGTYSVTAMNDPELYLTGDHYNWGNPWKQLIPVHSSDTDFWMIIYLHADEQFKFAPQAGWGNDFGTEAELIDKAGAEPYGSGNICVKNAGWYLLHVVNGSSRTVTFLKPNVYLMGDTAGEWNIADSHLFTVPSGESGQFVSPAFAADAELRMCVKLDEHDWWKTEFIIANGKIDFRGKGDDQARLSVKQGQKAYLNFSDGTAEVK